VGGSTVSATEAAGRLVGQALTSQTIAAAADLAAAAARPRTDHRGTAEYKRHMVRTFVLRILSRGDGEAGQAAGDTRGANGDSAVTGGRSGAAGGGSANGGAANGGGSDAERAA